MSEGLEVKITADKLYNALSDKKTIQDILCKKIDNEIKRKIIGSSMEYIKTFGKNIIIKFSSGVYLRNHMMMWGKWRIYDKDEYEKGVATSPPRFTYKKNNQETGENKINKVMDVRKDSRVRLYQLAYVF